MTNKTRQSAIWVRDETHKLRQAVQDLKTDVQARIDDLQASADLAREEGYRDTEALLQSATDGLAARLSAFEWAVEHEGLETIWNAADVLQAELRGEASLSAAQLQQLTSD